MVTANGEVQTNVAAQIYVHVLDLFVTVQILVDTLAVQSLSKLCEEHGYSCEWASGQNPHTSGASSCSTSLQQDSLRTSSSPAEVRSDDESPGNLRDRSQNFKQIQKEGQR